uniref:Phosphoribosyltransferase n=1 Tax=Balbiania investiens TaxID=111861 RepID=A0A4D6BLD0_9FLOR|nr:Phosphoribosyltransferase [Balbiania investiens]QBX88560.1 Phosphoribosyltransferase [Balbiania investiens]
MPLNIYTINHPLVRIWTSYLCNNNMQISEKEMMETIHKIGMILVYESTRKSLNANNFYIKKLEEMIEVNLFPQQSFYSFISDMYLSQILSKDISYLVPNSKVYTIHPYLKNNKWVVSQDYNSIPQNLINHQNVVIMEQYLVTGKLLAIIDLLLHRHASIKNIRICCILCSTETFKAIGSRYPGLNIYTTKIIDDNSNQNMKSFCYTHY